MKFMEKLLVGEKVEWKKLGEVANCFSGGTPKTSNSSFYDGEIPWIRSGEINFNVIKKSERNITKEGLEKSSAKMIKKNSVVLAMTGATVGRTAVVEIETSSNQSVAAIETNNRIINYKYLFYFLAKEYNNLKKLGQGALTSLNLSIIKNIKIPVPSIETQEKIVKILDNFTKYVTELQAELQARNKQYNYYRDMLLSEDYLHKISEKYTENQFIEWKMLGELFEFKNGLNKGKDFFGKGTPIINYMDVYKRNKIYSNDLIGLVETTENEQKRYSIKRGDVFFTRTSETKEEIGKTSVLLDDVEKGVFSGFVLRARPITELLLPEYCAYCFETYEFRKNVIRYSTYTTRALTNGTTLSNLKIPVPSIEIQNKIVKILDRFQELLSDTKGLLPLEIEQRRKQYEYYREKLLTFDKEEGYALSTAQRQITSEFFELLKEAAKIADIDINDKVEWKTLGEIAVGNLTYGSGASAIEYDGEVRYVRITDIDINGNLKEEKFSPIEVEEKYFLNYGDILFARSGATVGKNYIHQTEEKSIYAGYLIRLIVNQKLALAKYIYHCINTTEYFKFVENTKSNGSQPNINAKQYSDFKILLPPLPVQEYIVSILDKFDALVNDLSQGLPREIELRQKQYEYYREKLLDFEK